MLCCCYGYIQYTFSELVDVVQVSDVELREALVQLNACLIHGKFDQLLSSACVFFEIMTILSSVTLRACDFYSLLSH